MKYILITGVSTGIGNGVLQELLTHGFTVFGTVRGDRDAKSLQHSINNENFIPLVMDVTNEKTIAKAFQKVKKILGKNFLDALINNAGTIGGGPFTHLSEEKYRQVMDVNFFGTLAMMRIFIPLLSNPQNPVPAKIINVSSVLGHYGLPYLSPYVASKFALEGFADCVRQELDKINIKLVVLIPGAVKTQIFKKGVNEDHSDIENTIHEKSGKTLKQQMLKLEDKGILPKHVGHKVLKILSAKRPKTRYLISGSPFIEWYWPKYLPDKILDYILLKLIG